jgi:uncharacterized membrane protein YdcZ (DUF606 family)
VKDWGPCKLGRNRFCYRFSVCITHEDGRPAAGFWKRQAVWYRYVTGAMSAVYVCHYCCQCAGR